MKSNRYTVHIVSDIEDTQKRFSISRFWLRTFILICIILVISIGGGLWYYIPRIAEFREKNAQFEQMIAERKMNWRHYYDGKKWSNDLASNPAS
mgnify:CR=1 FL=1